MKKKKLKAIELNKLDEETIKNIRVWRNTPFVRQNMYNKQEITEEEHLRYIDSVKADENRGLFVFYADDEPIGVYQYTINPSNNCITGGHYLIDEELQCMGYGVLMSYLLTYIDFDVLQCNKNYGEVLSINTRLIELNRKFNVPLEGILRQHAMVDGEYCDVYCYGTLKSEWDNYGDILRNKVYRIAERTPEIIM